MTAFAVDGERRWNTSPRWRRRFSENLTRGGFQMGDLVELNGFQSWIGNRQRFAFGGVTRFKLLFCVSAFTDANKKISRLAPNIAAHPERVTQIGMAALIERAIQSDPRLYRNQRPTPLNLRNEIARQEIQAARLTKLYS